MQRDERLEAEELLQAAYGETIWQLDVTSIMIDACELGIITARGLYGEQVEQAAQSLPLKERNEFFAALRKVQGRAP